jgi:hypothetical protein
MLWVLLVVSIDEILVGINILDLIFATEQSYGNFYYFCYFIANFVFLVGMEAIFWFVSFKYWETARQVSRVMRIIKNRALPQT